MVGFLSFSGHTLCSQFQRNYRWSCFILQNKWLFVHPIENISFADDVVLMNITNWMIFYYTATPFKHTDDLKEYVNNKTARVSDAVVGKYPRVYILCIWITFSVSLMCVSITGLSSIIECRSKGQAPLYLCVSCSRKLSHNLIIEHLRKPGHRDSYLVSLIEFHGCFKYSV